MHNIESQLAELTRVQAAMQAQLRDAKFKVDLVDKLADDGILKLTERSIMVSQVEKPLELVREVQHEGEIIDHPVGADGNIV